MDIIVIVDTQGKYKAVLRNNEKDLMYWAEHYQAKNGLIGSIYLEWELSKLTIGTETLLIYFESL